MTSSLGMGTLCLLLHTGILSGLNLYKSCMCCCSLYELIWVSTLLIYKTLFPWSHPQPPVLLVFLPSLLQRLLSLEERVIDKDIPFRAEHAKVSTHCTVVGFCAIFHLLQQASLMSWAMHCYMDVAISIAVMYCYIPLAKPKKKKIVEGFPQGQRPN